MNRPRTTRRALLAVTGLLLAAAAGCAQPSSSTGIGGGGVGSDLPLTSVALGMDCASGGNPTTTPPALVPLPADAVLVSATRCLFEPRLVARDGAWLFRVEQRADSGLDALAAALRLPSEENSGGICPAIGYGPIMITVTDQQGRQLTPSIPHTACGAPLTAATGAIEALTWITVGSTKVHQTRSQLELDSGCAGRYKQVLALTTPPTSPVAAPGTPAYLPSAPLRVCRYGLDPDPTYQLSSEGSAPVHGGLLSGSSTLDGRPAQDLLAALTSAPAATGPCAHRESAFAIVYSAKDTAGGASVAIELGGCYRAAFDSDRSTLRQLDAATVAVLTKSRPAKPTRLRASRRGDGREAGDVSSS